MSFIDRPRRHTGRRWLFLIHLWVGLIIGPIVGVVTLTGAIVVFRYELNRMTTPGTAYVTPQPQAERLSVDEMASRIHAAWPNDRPADSRSAPTRGTGRCPHRVRRGHPRSCARSDRGCRQRRRPGNRTAPSRCVGSCVQSSRDRGRGHLPRRRNSFSANASHCRGPRTPLDARASQPPSQAR